MAELLTDGTAVFLGGMDTSRKPSIIAESQYAKAVNVILTDQGEVKTRFGYHYCKINFASNWAASIYRNGIIQGQGGFIHNNIIYLIVVVDGYVFRLKNTLNNYFEAIVINRTDRNLQTSGEAWVINIPNGCVVNNGFDRPIFVGPFKSKRCNPDKGEIGIGKYGVYLQNRLFYVDSDGRRILASDFLKPLSFTREETNIFGFACPDADERIVAIGKQKTVTGTVEGGNLIWSSTKDIYSADVRGSRSDWANLSSSVGKTSETIPGFSATSSHSFEPYNTNLYFRSANYGICSIKQSGFQFQNLDSVNYQSIQGSYFLDNDADVLLDRAYTRACNERLYTTVAPEITEKGGVVWNGLIVYNPRSIYAGLGEATDRFESVFTGLKAWGLTTVSYDNGFQKMFVHALDGSVNNLYVMDESIDYDVNSAEQIKEIQGFIETRAFNFKSPFSYKKIQKRMYSLGMLDRSVSIKVYSRPEEYGEWIEFWNTEHKICRDNFTTGKFTPIPHKGQTRNSVFLSEESSSECYNYGSLFAVQYRIEFTGPINLNAFIVTATIANIDSTISSEDSCETMVYEYRPDYYYSL